MRTCKTCGEALTSSQDDKKGSHKVCPPKPDREAYLALRKKRFPTHDDYLEQRDKGEG